MSRRLHRLWLLPALLLASQSWALGLGDIRLNSALNEPLRAEIELFSATDEEVKNLTIQLASIEAFDRYDLDRPLFLTGLRFDVVLSGNSGSGIVRVTSAEPVTEPFVTFLVEAAWSRGRLFREYTILLDPPTFAPPPATQTPRAVTAPSQATQSDRGEIQRPAPATQPAPQAPPRQVVAPAPAPQPAADEPDTMAPEPAQPAADVQPAPASEADFDTAAGGQLEIRRGDTLWGIAQRMRPDSRLTVQQTMLAIYETNPQAFGGNINRMSAGATLQIPSADDVFRISRNEALAEVQRQNEAWGAGGTLPSPPQQSLTLVPPDEDVDIFDADAGQPAATDDSSDEFIDPDDARISEIEAQLIDHQNSVIEISDNELASLRAELAALRGEAPPEPAVDAAPPVADDPVIDETPAIDDVIAGDADSTADLAPVEPIVDDPQPDVEEPPVTTVRTAPEAEEGLLDTVLGYLSSFWVLIGGAIAIALGLLFWFARRPKSSADTESTGMWEALDDDADIDGETMASTERLRAMARDDDTAIVVVEQESHADTDAMLDTLEVPAAGLAFDDDEEEDDFAATSAMHEEPAPAPAPAAFEPPAEPDAGPSIDDTFSSETAINLDQSDPIAEADFHMAYGLYDQAADLINGALEVDSGNQELLAKLCEIYFVWGNRDAFIDAAGKMRALSGGQGNAEWDKIVIMGQQIASDHEMFSGASAGGGATRAVDLEFDAAPDDGGMLDIDLAGGDADGDMIDLGDDTGMMPEIDPDAALEFDLGDPVAESDSAETQEVAPPTVEMPEIGETAEMPGASVSDTVESPTIEQQFAPNLGPNDATELASLDDLDDFDDVNSEATAEIDLDDLDLDLVGLHDAPIGGDDDDAIDFDATQESPGLGGDDSLAETGRNPTLAASLDETGNNPSLDATGHSVALDLEAYAASTGAEGRDLSDDDKTQLAGSLSDDEKTLLAGSLDDDERTLMAGLDDDDDSSHSGGKPPAGGGEMATLVAPLDDDDSSTTVADDEEFDFAASMDLPSDALSRDADSETGELPGIPGSTDMDLDLDDLTAALQVSEVGDTVARKHFADDAATVEQPMIRPETVDVDTESTGLNDARTMTEVGTKLDLARAYVDMGDPSGARSILEEVLDEGDEGQRQQAQRLLENLPS